MKSNKHAGQFNLKGKKCLALRCGCCEVINFKEEIETQRQKKELLSVGLINSLTDRDEIDD